MSRKFTEEFRKDIWKEYEGLAYDLIDLKAIVQSEMKITAQDLINHRKTTIRVKEKLDELSRRIMNNN